MAVQAVQMVAKQEASQKLADVIAEGTRLATLLRSSVRQHYGIRAEKLVEFGVKPFQGRKPRTNLKGKGSRLWRSPRPSRRPIPPSSPLEAFLKGEPPGACSARSLFCACFTPGKP